MKSACDREVAGVLCCAHYSGPRLPAQGSSQVLWKRYQQTTVQRRMGVATTGLLWHALGICPGEVVVFTGGPARTSLALRVARELTEAGRPPVLNEVGGCVVLVEAGGGPARLSAGLREVLVVTGAYHEALAPLLSRYPVRVIPNPDWAEGMSTSLRAGLRALVGEPEAVVVCLGDMPFLPPAVVTELVRAYRRTGAPIVAPEVGGVRRSPVLFDRALLPELMAIRGDEGGRAVVQRHQAEMVLVPFPEERWFRDVDEPGDLRE
mgnify:CR=1 FL=1